MKNKRTSKQVNTKSRSFVTIDSGLHQLLKIKAASDKTTIKTLVEQCLAELLEVKND